MTKSGKIQKISEIVKKNWKKTAKIPKFENIWKGVNKCAKNKNMLGLKKSC